MHGERARVAGWALWHVLLSGQTHPFYPQPSTGQCTAIRRKPSSCSLESQELLSPLTPAPLPILFPPQDLVNISGVRGCLSVKLSLEQGVV